MEQKSSILQEYKDKYMNLELEVKNHYFNKILVILLLYIVPLIAIFLIHSYKLALLSFICVSGELLYLFYQLKQFCDGKIYKLTGICTDIQDQRYENKNLNLNIYGKYTIYIESDGDIYEIMTSRNYLIKKGCLVTVWYNGNTYLKNGNITVIPTVYITTITPQN